MNKEILKIVNVRSPNLNELIRNKFTKMPAWEENIENYLIKNLKESNGKYEEIPQFEGYEEENRESAGRNDSGKEEKIGNSPNNVGKIFRQSTGGKNAWQQGVGNNSNNVGKEIRKSFGGKKYGEYKDRKASFGGKKDGEGEKIRNSLKKVGSKEKNIKEYKEVGETSGVKKVGNNLSKVENNKINKETPRNKLIQKKAELKKRNISKV